jgi:lysophospholipase L1-like esterase
MRTHTERALDYGIPIAVILFGGVNDAVRNLSADETADNAKYMLSWLKEHDIERVLVVGTAHLNWTCQAGWWDASLRVREVLREVAQEQDVMFVDLGGKQLAMIENGRAPNFAIEPYRQRDSWHVYENNQHFNARGQRLVANTIASNLFPLLR